MKHSRFTEEQIIGILCEQESGQKTADVCRCHQTLKEVDRHTKAASQERLAEQARQKVEGDK